MDFLILAFLLFIGFLIQTISGFGSTIFILSLGILYFDFYELLPLVLKFNIIMSLYFLVLYHKYIDIRFLLKSILLYMLVGFILGLHVSNMMKYSSIPIKKIFAGLIFLLSSLEILILYLKIPLKIFHPLYGKFWVFLAGIIHGIFATGGPFLVYGLSHLKIDRDVFRISLLFVWLIFDSWLLFSLPIKTNHFITFISLLFILPLSIYVGQRFYYKISIDKFHLIIRLLLVLISIINILNGK